MDVAENTRIRYSWATIRHKWFVLRASFKVGLPLWRALVHDLSKFLPVELFPYNNFFFGDRSDLPGFAMALLHHWNANLHHYQYWTDRPDHSGHYRKAFEQSGVVQNGVFRMPTVYVREMVADWMGASMTHTGSWDMTAWLSKNLMRINVHPSTMQDLVSILSTLGYKVVMDRFANSCHVTRMVERT